MMINSFNTPEETESFLVSHIGHIINQSIQTFGNAFILLAGGKTPSNLYSELSKVNIEWEKVTIGLTDERYFLSDSTFLNESMIRNQLLQNHASKSRFINLIYNKDDESANAELANSAYAPFKVRLDLVLLGVGLDGHYASIFPQDSYSAVASSDPQKNIAKTVTTAFPNHRITCNKQLLLGAKRVIVYANGTDKYDLILNESLQLPIHDFLNQAQRVELFITEN